MGTISFMLRPLYPQEESRKYPVNRRMCGPYDLDIRRIHLSCPKIKPEESSYKPGQALRTPGVQGSQVSRQSAHEGGKFVSPTHRPPSFPGNIPGTHSYQRLSRPQRHSAAWRIMSTKHSSNTTGNQTRDLPACSSVPQQTAPSVLKGAIVNINL